MNYSSWPPASSSPLFAPSGLKRAGEYLTEADLEAQYGYMTDSGERALRQQMQAAGRPLTRAEQRDLMKQHGGMAGLFADMETATENSSKFFIILILIALFANVLRGEKKAAAARKRKRRKRRRKR